MYELGSVPDPEVHYFVLFAQPREPEWEAFREFASGHLLVPMAVSVEGRIAVSALPIRWWQGVKLSVFGTKEAAEEFAATLGLTPHFVPFDEVAFQEELREFERAVERGSLIEVHPPEFEEPREHRTDRQN